MAGAPKVSSDHRLSDLPAHPSQGRRRLLLGLAQAGLVSRAQFERAYPEVSELRRLKQAHDPAGKLSTQLWARYL